MIYNVAFGIGFKCPRKIHLNTQCRGAECKSNILTIVTSIRVNSSIKYLYLSPTFNCEKRFVLDWRTPLRIACPPTTKAIELSAFQITCQIVCFWKLDFYAVLKVANFLKNIMCPLFTFNYTRSICRLYVGVRYRAQSAESGHRGPLYLHRPGQAGEN